MKKLIGAIVLTCALSASGEGTPKKEECVEKNRKDYYACTRRCVESSGSRCSAMNCWQESACCYPCISLCENWLFQKCGVP